MMVRQEIRQGVFCSFLFVIHITLTTASMASGQTDNDNDGVPESEDRCPNTAQLYLVPGDFKYTLSLNPERLAPHPKAWPVDQYGCELDNDNDDVINSRDFCPDNTQEELAMGVSENGCPRQSDQDGTPDYRDLCPDTPSTVETDQHGCPK